MKLEVLCAALLLSGCNVPHYYYSSPVQNVPLFTEEYQLAGSAVGSLGNINGAFEVQAGLSFPHHIALTSNLMIGGNRRLRDSYEDFTRIRYFESALGFYAPFGASGAFEMYGGYGRGTEKHKFTYAEVLPWFVGVDYTPDGTADYKLSKIFLQTNIGVHENWFEGAFSGRISRLNFSDFDIATMHHLDELNILREHPNPWLFEPAVTLRIGSEKVKGQFQFVYSMNMLEPAWEFENVRVGLGIFFRIPALNP